MTMTEIAKQAGVSQATVSRVLSGRGGVKKSKEEAVLKAVKALKYRAKPRKQRQLTGRQNIGLYFTGSNFERSSAPLYCKYNTIATNLPRRYNAVLLPTGIPVEKLEQEVKQRGVVGLLVTGHKCSRELEKVLARIPHVWLNSHEQQSVKSILGGNTTAGKLAADYLLDKGCSRLGAIRVPSHNPGYAARIDGFLQEAYTKGQEAMVFPCGEDTQYFEDIDWQELELIIDRTFDFLAEKIALCDGFFCPDDRVTAILYRILQKHDISLFNNIRVVSCNNDQKSLAGLYPRPATIDFAPELTAKLAIEELLNQLDGIEKDEKVAIIVRPELIENQDL